jgi:hypothetical protein
MKRFAVALAFAAAINQAQAQTPATPACYEQGLICTRTEFGLLVTKEHEPARIRAIISAAKAAFRTHFGADAPPSAFIEDDTAISRFNRLREPLNAAGYPVILPWPAPSVFKSALAPQEAALRKKLWHLPEGMKKQAIEKVSQALIDRVAFDAIAMSSAIFGWSRPSGASTN